MQRRGRTATERPGRCSRLARCCSVARVVSTDDGWTADEATHICVVRVECRLNLTHGRQDTGCESSSMVVELTATTTVVTRAHYNTPLARVCHRAEIGTGAKCLCSPSSFAHQVVVDTTSTPAHSRLHHLHFTPLAMSVPWTVSATSLVRDILSKNRYMKNPQIWQAATFGERPILQAKTALDLNGRIRMKKVSNIREGRRQWVPPPVKPLPEHPFQSMR